MIDISAFRRLLLTVTSWLDRREREVLAHLIEVNRVGQEQVGGRRVVSHGKIDCRGVDFAGAAIVRLQSPPNTCIRIQTGNPSPSLRSGDSSIGLSP